MYKEKLEIRTYGDNPPKEEEKPEPIVTPTPEKPAEASGDGAVVAVFVCLILIVAGFVIGYYVYKRH